jgi:hypothetical protein
LQRICVYALALLSVPTPLRITNGNVMGRLLTC